MCYAMIYKEQSKNTGTSFVKLVQNLGQNSFSFKGAEKREKFGI